MRDYNKIQMVPEVLDQLTQEQLQAIKRLVKDEHSIEVYPGGFSLPNGYIAFSVHYKDGSNPLYGGIAPNGDVST